jgi:ribosome modulation factor
MSEGVAPSGSGECPYDEADLREAWEEGHRDGQDIDEDRYEDSRRMIAYYEGCSASMSDPPPPPDLGRDSPYDQDERPELHRSFCCGWRDAPDVADIHIDVTDDDEGSAYLEGIFARLIEEDLDFE